MADLKPLPAGMPMLPAGMFEGKVALITGGGTGLGRAMAVEFARLGATIVIASRDADHRAQGVASVEATGGKAVGVAMDIRRPGEVEDGFNAAEAQAGPVDMLVNNAAANFFSPAEEITPDGWGAVVDRVLTGTFQCAREYARRRLANGGGGSILNIVSTPGILGGPGVAHSAAAKAGVVNLTRSLAVEWARDGIRVNAIAPGSILHDDGRPEIRAARVGWEDAHERTPLGRTGEPREVAWLATFLASPFADFITGQVVTIDGGLSLPRGAPYPIFEPIRERLAPKT